MSRNIIIAAVAALVASSIASVPAEARSRGHSVHAHGPHGHGYNRSRHVSRQPGHVAVSRNLQTHGGRGHASNRYANWGNGSYSGGASHVLNNGTSWGRSRQITNNGDGSYSYNFVRNGPHGGSRSRSGIYTPNH